MREFILLLILGSILAPGLAWTVGDRFCEKETGESCMNSLDCPICEVSLNVTHRVMATQDVLTVIVKSGESADVGIVLTVESGGEVIHHKSFELLAMQEVEYEFPVLRLEDTSEVMIIVKDRDIGTMWNREIVSIEGLSTKNPGFEMLIPAAALIVFFSILYIGLKKPKPSGPYGDESDFVPYMPTGAPPGAPAQIREPVTEEQIVVVTKKRKYYHKKKKSRKRKLK